MSDSTWLRSSNFLLAMLASVSSDDFFTLLLWSELFFGPSVLHLQKTAVSCRAQWWSATLTLCHVSRNTLLMRLQSPEDDNKMEFNIMRIPYLPTRTVDRPSLPTSLWRTSGLLVETSEFASRLILLIQISSHGNCCIDWTTKARRKTLQHLIIHTDRHTVMPFYSSLHFPLSFLLSSYPYFFTGRIGEVGGGEQTYCDPIFEWECLGVFSPQLLSLFPSLTFYLDSHCLFISTFTDVTSNVQGTLS